MFGQHTFQIGPSLIEQSWLPFDSADGDNVLSWRPDQFIHIQAREERFYGGTRNLAACPGAG